MENKGVMNYGTGAIPDVKDERDYKYEDVMGAVVLPENYNVLDELPYKIKVENQGQSSSCVGQAWSKYIEVLNYFDEKKQRDASAKFVYSRIFLPQGGAHIRDGANLCVDVGVSQEDFDPSYENGQPPSEAYMRIKNENIAVLENAKVYQAKEYRTIWHQSNIETIKNAIFNNKGVISGFLGDNEGWSSPDGIVKPPASESKWGHAVYLIGWEKINGEDYILFLNSWSSNWGRGGVGLMPPSYWTIGGLAFNLWTLTDKQLTNNSMYKYAIDENNNQHILYTDLKIDIEISDVKDLDKLVANGLTGAPEQILTSELNGYYTISGVEKARFVPVLKELFNL